MRHWDRFLQITGAAVLLAGLAACGGGGQSVSGGSSLPRPNNAPSARVVGHSPGDAPLVRFKPYTFTASATDPDVGDTILKYEWDFADGSALVQTTGASVTHTYTTSSLTSTDGVAGVRVRAYDNRGLAGSYLGYAVTVDSSPSPITAAFQSPASAVSLQADPSGGVQIVFTVKVETTAAGTISLSGVNFYPGEASAQILNSQNQGGGVFTFTVRYLGASAAGVRTVTPTVSALDSAGISSEVVLGPAITVTTLSITNHAPAIVVTNPVTTTSSAYTSKPLDLGFTLTDPDGDVINYTVDWGDGTTISQGSATGDTVHGIAIALQHTFPDSFTSGTRSSTVTINATDGRSNNGVAQPQSRIIAVTYNTYPTASITTPQASAFLPSTTDLPSNAGLGLVNPPGASDPDILVIPSGGKVSFSGATTLPGSQDTLQSYTWTFQGGIPSSYTGGASPGEVVFPGNPGSIAAFLVEFQVKDSLGRASSAAPGVNPKSFRKWIVVDGKNTQQFKLNFMYRKIADNNGQATLSAVAMPTHGLGASVRVFQDGQTNSYLVQDPALTKAQVSIPVRSNLPFYVLIPNFNATVDNTTYLMRIPNAPTGAYADPTLGTSLLANASSFGFENATAPWNPVLQVVTAQGFAPELAASPERRLLGTVAFTWGVTTPPNVRYLDRLSVPLDGTDSLGALNQWVQVNNGVGGVNGARAQQQIAEWVAHVGNHATADTPAVAGAPDRMRFTLNYPKYTADTQLSETFAHEAIQAFRVPPGVTDPFNLDVAGWRGSSAVVELNPTPLPGSYNAFLYNAVFGSPGASAFHGGLQNVPIPYEANDPDRKPYTVGRTYPFAPFRAVFGFSEYLWSSVWARPLILNVANPNVFDSMFYLDTFPFFRNSNPTSWPQASGIVPDNSAFNMNVTGGGTFDASSPVGVGGTPPGSTGVGRFYWTAYSPFYNAAADSVISRTWLSDATGKPPLAITGGTGDATVAFGFLPPQDTVVDKRGRKVDGSLSGSNLGGYRVTWFNPTRDPVGLPVPPDFWVVEFTTPTGLFHFLLPPSFPAGSQSVSDLVLTDARTYLPSGRTNAQGPAADSSDMVAPGYCWFDVPTELRPSISTPGATSFLRVFAVKSILKNNPPAGARPLNRPDWMDALKTALPEISVISLSGELSYAHKIPFNFFWDIVVVNGPKTPVAP